MQFNANYTLSHSLGTSVQGSTAPGYYGGGGIGLIIVILLILLLLGRI